MTNPVPGQLLAKSKRTGSPILREHELRYLRPGELLIRIGPTATEDYSAVVTSSGSLAIMSTVHEYYLEKLA